MNEPVFVTLLVINVFEKLGVPYFIGGSFASPEDTILAKLEWYQRGGGESEIQWRDIKAILQQRSDQLDLKYLNGSAKGLKISDLLERSLEESHR